jgi:hypothetical protein
VRRSLVLLAALGAMSCAVALDEPVARVPEPAARPSDVVIPDDVLRDVVMTEPSPQAEWKLGTNEILLQLEYEPTFTVVHPCDASQPFGRVPEVTLYEDGTIIYESDAGVMVYGIGEKRAAQQHAHVVELGIAQVRSKEDDCRTDGDVTTCLSDSGFAVLRVRAHDGKLRELRNYAGWADERQATLHAVYDRLKLLRQPYEWETRRYVPEHATLFLALERDEDSRERRERAKDWPLGDALLERVIAKRQLVLAIDAATIATLAAAIGTNATSRVELRHDDVIVSAALVPWLPGVDYPSLPRWP